MKVAIASVLKCVDKMAIVLEVHEFATPKRAVLNMDDMLIWEKSEAYLEYVGFIQTLNEAVKEKSLGTVCPMTSVTKGMLALLDELDRMIDETPPVEQPQRFGNQAFRVWYSKLKDGALTLLQKALPAKFLRAIPEIMVYLIEGFGNPTRIDYGTGHEMAFLMLLCCLFKIGAFVESDKVSVVCLIFNRYLILVRKLQLAYRMEPAGSHGVWSLDDYQFVPFIWGSAQLVDHPRIEPKSFLQEEIVNTFAKDYMFIGCIEFINKVKTGLFAEHSNQLWNISGVQSWSKINAGLIKMYKAEILAKFPVIQHVLFGSLLPFKVARVSRPFHNVHLSLAESSPPSFSTPDSST